MYTTTTNQQTPIESVFIINDEKSAKQILENPSLSQYFAKDPQKTLAVYSTYDGRTSLVELSLVGISPFEFIDVIREISVYSEVKLIPCHFMRSLCVRNINELAPVSDIYFAVSKLTSDIKKIVYMNDLNFPGIGRKMCFIEYESHQSAKNALKILNGSSYSNTNQSFFKILNIHHPIEAFWVEPLIDNVKEVLKNTQIFIFENLSVNTTSVFNFKEHLENFFVSQNEKIAILRMRQYSDKIIVEFNLCPKSLQKFISSDKKQAMFSYKGKLLPVIPAMRPCLNVGKYRERGVKVSCQLMGEGDKRILLSRFGESFNFVNEPLKKKAESLYNKLLHEEKKEKEKEKERERVREREIENNNIKIYGGSNTLVKHKRERIEEDEPVVVGKLNKKNEKYTRDNKGSERVLEKRRDDVGVDNKKKQRNEQSAMSEDGSINQSACNTLSGNVNTLSQLGNILPLLNCQGNNSQINLQNILSNLANLQSLINNPGMLNVIQQLAGLNTFNSMGNLNSSSTLTNNTPAGLNSLNNVSTINTTPSQVVPTSTPIPSTSLPPNPIQPYQPSNQSSMPQQSTFTQNPNTTGGSSFNKVPPQGSSMPTGINFSTPQMNPMYTIPKNSNAPSMDQQVYYQQMGMPGNKVGGYFGMQNSQGPYPYQMNPNDMYMQQSIYPGMPMQNEGHNQNESQVGHMNNMNMDHFKNYYDYIQQNLNK